MTKRLEMRFKTEEGKNRVIGIDQPKTNVEPVIVQEAMEQIIAQDMFEIDGFKTFAKIKGARYVTRSVDDILNLEKA